MRSKQPLSIYILSCVAIFGSTSLLAQADKTPAISNATELDAHACDSLRDPVPGESLADAARRIRAWKNCAENVRSTTERVVTEHLVKRVEVENGHVVVGAMPSFVDGRSILIRHLDIYVRNSSPLEHQYALALKCGSWNKSVSGSTFPSSASPTNQELGKPSFSLDVSPTCSLNDMALDLSSPDELKGSPHTSASAVPGVSDGGMAQNPQSLKGSSVVEMREAASNSISNLEQRLDEACKRPLAELLTEPVSAVVDHAAACAKAYDDLTPALESRGEAESRARAEALNQEVSDEALIVRLTGTEGLPFSGTCSYSNRAGTVSKTYDEVVPFQVTMKSVDSVNCSFISKSDFRHDLKLEIIKNGRIIGESDTDAPYGLVGVARDVN